MSYQKVQPYHIDMADHLNPPSPIKLVAFKVWTLGTFSGIGNAAAGFILFAAFMRSLDWWVYVLAIVAFLLIGLMVQHTLYDNYALTSRKNMKLPDDRQLSYHTFENVSIRGLNIFCAVVLSYLLIIVIANSVELKEKQAMEIEQEIKYQQSVRDTLAAQYDRKIREYTEMKRIKYYANVEESKKMAMLDSMQTEITGYKTQLASVRNSLATSINYLEVFEFLSFGVKAIAILLSLIAGGFYASIIDSGFCGAAIVYSNYKYATGLKQIESDVNRNNDTVRPAAPNDPPENNFETDREKKLRNIMQRIRDGNPKDNAVVIAKYLNNSRKTYDEISEALKHDLGVSKSTSWIGDVQEALKRMGENVRK